MDTTLNLPKVGDLIIQPRTLGNRDLIGLVLRVSEDEFGGRIRYLKLGDNKVYSTQWRVWSDKYWTIVPGSP